MHVNSVVLVSLVVMMYQMEVSLGHEMSKNGVEHTASMVELDWTPFRAVTISVPDVDTARAFARGLIARRLAAVVNIIPTTITLYPWNGMVHELPEVFMLVYTHVSAFKSLEQFVKENHVHIEPGIMGFPIVSGGSSFLKWLQENIAIQEQPVQQPQPVQPQEANMQQQAPPPQG